MTDTPVLLRAAGVGVLLDVTGPELPRILHWGADPGIWARTTSGAWSRTCDPRSRRAASTSRGR